MYFIIGNDVRFEFLHVFHEGVKQQSNVSQFHSCFFHVYLCACITNIFTNNLEAS